MFSLIIIWRIIKVIIRLIGTNYIHISKALVRRNPNPDQWNVHILIVAFEKFKILKFDLIR